MVLENSRHKDKFEKSNLGIDNFSDMANILTYAPLIISLIAFDMSVNLVTIKPGYETAY